MSAVPSHVSESLQRLRANVESVFLGKEDLVNHAITCLLAGGHFLLEDVPGVGKTLLARALSKSLGLKFSRIQFTSDLLPADILGVSVFDQQAGEFVLKPGPIFSNLVLADEINRTAPRTQSSLLEAMAEQRVSIDDETYALEAPFLVIATQNPLESHGTYPLPDSQLDRFLMRLSIGYPQRSVEREILLQQNSQDRVDQLDAVMTQEELLQLQRLVSEVHFSETLADYVLDIVEATRGTVRLTTGVSIRGALALQQASRAWALLQGRNYVLPDDVKRLAVPVLAHRVSLGAGETVIGSSRHAQESLVHELLAEVPVPN